MSLEGDEYEKMGLVSSEVKAERKTLKHQNHRKTSELHELVTNETLT